MNLILSIVIVLALLGVAGGCASNSGPESAGVDRSAIQIGMTEQEVDDLMRPVARDKAIDHRDNVKGVRYDTGDRFMFVDGRLKSYDRK